MRSSALHEPRESVADRDLVRRLVGGYGVAETEAYFVCPQAGRVRFGDMVDPKYTLGASMLKACLG
jgi:amidase